MQRLSQSIILEYNQLLAVYLFEGMAYSWIHILSVKGELALEEHSGAGPTVDAKVSEARVVHRLHPDTVRAGHLEETLHTVSPGAATQPAAGQEIRPWKSLKAQHG